MSDPKNLLVQMLTRSTIKLNRPDNLAKGSWVHMTDYEVLNRIKDEMQELKSAMSLRRSDGSMFWERIAEEAADVYHFASMGADPARIANVKKSEPTHEP